MTNEEALLRSNLGIKLRLTIWQKHEYITSVTREKEPFGNDYRYSGYDENGNYCSFYGHSGFELIWEIYHEPE